MRLRRLFALAALPLAASGFLGCPSPQDSVQVKGQVSLTLLHTSDIHSRLFPYDFQIGTIDAQLGLGPNGSVQRIGGAAKISHIVGRERARSERVLHLDGGDCFQGAPVFNFFSGEAEIRALSEMGTDAMIIANHEFDRGPLNVGEQIQKWATFPVLAANYKFSDITDPRDPGLARVLVPWTSFNVGGLKVGVVGFGNLSTVSSLFEQPNSLGITPLNTQETAQFYVDLVRPLVDVVVLVTHLGLEYDERMIANTTGIDVVLGGHNHIVLQPPKAIDDCQNIDETSGQHYVNILSGTAQAAGQPAKYERRRCNPRRVLLAHSGAFARYVGRLDLVLSNDPKEVGAGYDPINGFEVLQSDYKLIPVTEDVPEDPHVRQTLMPYKAGLDALIDLDLLVGYAPQSVERTAPSGGDSPLGNMVATAAWLRQGVQTDFALTNTTGIRAEIPPGPVTIEQMFNVFPFDNSITKMLLSGSEVQEVFDFAARRSASRGCVSQVQIAGARVAMNCDGCGPALRPDLAITCTADDQCPFGGLCVDDPASPGSKRCKVACAQHVYIGRNEDAKCKTDNDCCNKAKDPACTGTIGSCDNYKLDAGGFGRCATLIDPIASYELATSNYIAQGGSGYSVLKRNTTQFDTGVQQRDALVDFMRNGHPCGWSKDAGTEDGLKACSVDSECGTDAVCACVGHVTADASGVCQSQGSCNGAGRCVLRGCRDGVATFHRRTCTESSRSDAARQSCEAELNPCELGGEECKFLSCIDQKVGNFTDGRLIMVGR